MIQNTTKSLPDSIIPGPSRRLLPAEVNKHGVSRCRVQQLQPGDELYLTAAARSAHRMYSCRIAVVRVNPEGPCIEVTNIGTQNLSATIGFNDIAAIDRKALRRMWQSER